ncbi:MAG: NADP-dependent phosphogluconate dehydrogenase, partial [Desulfobacterales bacterium]
VQGEPCVSYMGPRGAGHFVKMVHNAIEYGDMQLIAEAYDILRRGLGLSHARLQEIFTGWNKGPLSSYLIEITSQIVNFADDQTDQPLLEMIVDQAGQKGTGRWASHAALDLGVPIPTINAAVEARALSGYQTQRRTAANAFALPAEPLGNNLDRFIDALGDALYASKICSYAQGMALLSQASSAYGYHLDYSEIARIWRGGCIIRARFLDDIQAVFKENPDLVNLLMAPFFQNEIRQRNTPWRQVLKRSLALGIPTPGMSASLAYFDSYRSARLPANLIQAQRDYFGAHTYRRIDRQGQFHTQWPA